MTPNTRRIVRLMDLHNRPDLLADYEIAHQRGNTPAAVLNAQRCRFLNDALAARKAPFLVRPVAKTFA